MNLEQETPRPQRRSLFKNWIENWNENWSEANLTALTRHLEVTYHGAIRSVLPGLCALAQKVAHVHGSRHANLLEVQSTVERLNEHLLNHLQEEERLVFPAFRNWENLGPTPELNANLNQWSHRMEEHHDEISEILSTLRFITADFLVPEDACNSYRSLFQGLEQMESDLHGLFHKEHTLLHGKFLLREHPYTDPPLLSSSKGDKIENNCCDA